MSFTLPILFFQDPACNNYSIKDCSESGYFLMTRVTINSGICGFTVTVTAEKVEGKRVRITLDTECEMVANMQEDVSQLDMRAAFTGHLQNPVYRSAAMHLKHAACPVPAGILKAVEVELGLCLPKDVVITFSGDE
jgi:hypothetical protein